jgi:IS605 OrfB family transposase
MVKFHTRTIKLKLSVVSENKAASWQRLRQISNDAWRAANWIASGQLFNDQLIRRIYARRKINAKEDKQAVEKVEQEFKEFFGTKLQATTERDIKEAFPSLPPCVTNPLNRVVIQCYNKEKRQMLSGNRSLRTYSRGMPIQTTRAAIEFYKNDENKSHSVRWKLGQKESINFSIYYGRDRANHQQTVSRIMEGDLDYCAPQIQLRNKDLLLLLPYKDSQQNIELNLELSVGVNLGVRYPAYVALSNGWQKKAIGSKDDFLKIRTQMHVRHRRLQRSLKATKGGKGRQKKLKPLNTLERKERNFARQYNHFVSKEVVNFALQHRAGLIKLAMLEGFGQDEQHVLVLRNWPYFELQNFIKYKAAIMGIKVVKVDPYRTNKTCSHCGHYEEDQRKAEGFVCKNCGAKINGDRNVAYNLARSKKIVSKKEKCEYYKSYKNIQK